MFRHILPNISGPLLVLAARKFRKRLYHGCRSQGLSFLASGVQPPHPAGKHMIRENYHFIMTDHALLAIIGLAIIDGFILQYPWQLGLRAARCEMILD